MPRWASCRRRPPAAPRSTSATAAWWPPTAMRCNSSTTPRGGSSAWSAPDGAGRVLPTATRATSWRPRQLATGASSRYGYDLTTPHQLITAIGSTGAGTAFVYSTTAPPAVVPVVDNLGTAASFAGRSVAGSLAGRASQRHAFSVRASEVLATAAGEVLVRVAVRHDVRHAAAGGAAGPRPVAAIHLPRVPAGPTRCSP